MPINLHVLSKNRYVKSLQSGYNNYMATYDNLLTLDNKLKTH